MIDDYLDAGDTMRRRRDKMMKTLTTLLLFDAYLI
jgi:hypothetical protein